MIWLLWTTIIVAATVALSSGVIYVAYPFVYRYDEARKAGVWQPAGVHVMAYMLFALALPANLVHNVSVAWFVFRDRPREGFTSKRIQRYIDGGPERWGDERYRKAVQWARFLNHHDPSPHITGVPDG